MDDATSRGDMPIRKLQLARQGERSGRYAICR